MYETQANGSLTEMGFKCENCLECYYCSQKCKDSHREPAKHSPRICSRFRSIAGVAQNQVSETSSALVYSDNRVSKAFAAPIHFYFLV